MVFGFRGLYGSGTIMVHNGTVKKIDAKFGYTTWHPSGKLITFSINKVRQFFHTAGGEITDVIDLDSAICYHDLKADKILSHPPLAKKDMLETWPTWSPDGKFLYFCSAPLLWQDKNKLPPPQYKDVKYNLMRISYDIETDKWGQIETVLTAEETGKSVLMPRISPDGKHLLFCMTEYGCFPVYLSSSDLYMMEIETGQYRKLDINSDRSESWHSWSSNSKWIAFSSKRPGGIYARTYLSHVDENGNASKPFIMPQKDPLFYDQFLRAYTLPELIATPVKVPEMKLAKTIRSKDKVLYDMPLTGATPSNKKYWYR
jgi:Tol biopolymer transport system component